jgi:hypothetical protein
LHMFCAISRAKTFLCDTFDTTKAHPTRTLTPQLWCCAKSAVPTGKICFLEASAGLRSSEREKKRDRHFLPRVTLFGRLPNRESRLRDRGTTRGPFLCCISKLEGSLENHFLYQSQGSRDHSRDHQRDHPRDHSRDHLSVHKARGTIPVLPRVLAGDHSGTIPVLRCQACVSGSGTSRGPLLSVRNSERIFFNRINISGTSNLVALRCHFDLGIQLKVSTSTASPFCLLFHPLHSSSTHPSTKSHFRTHTQPQTQTHLLAHTVTVSASHEQ